MMHHYCALNTPFWEEIQFYCISRFIVVLMLIFGMREYKKLIEAVNNMDLAKFEGYTLVLPQNQVCWSVALCYWINSW